MIIKVIKYYILFSIALFSCANFASAGLEITEIMYNPESGSAYEWVEIFNNSSNSIDLNKYRFFHGEESSGPITLKSGTTAILQPSQYAIIAKSLTNGYGWLNFSGSIFSAGTLSLPDSGDNNYIAISDSNKIILNDVYYDILSGGSKISKSSLSKINGDWQSGIPTPGEENQSLNNEKTNTDEEDSSEETVISKEEPELEILKITTKIISLKMVTAGIPFSINSLTTSNRGLTYAVGRFVWNFGDGMISEVNKVNPFDYVYVYPGEYVLTLSYFDSVFSEVADATNRVTIKVIPSEIYISSVGDDTDSFIEIENKSNYEIILSNWVVTGGVHYFKIPEGTTLLPNKKMKLSPKITGFVGDDIKSIIITNPSKEVIATYPIIKIQKSINKNTSTYAIAQKNVSALNKTPQVINLNDLEGSAEGADVSINKSTYAWIGLLVIIGLGVASFWIIKKKKNTTDDYVEKKIRAEDMTIIE
jgi:hypothetical protein